MINNYIANRSFAIVSGYGREGVVSEMGVTSRIDEVIEISFPKGISFLRGRKCLSIWTTEQE